LRLTQDIGEAALWIKENKVIAYPTEGIWGLGCLNKPELLAKLSKVKDRNINRKYILLASSVRLFTRKFIIKKEYAEKMMKYEKTFTTIIVPCGNCETVAVRFPKFPTLEMLLEKTGDEIISTSANISGSEPCRTAEDIKKVFFNKIFGILDLPLGKQGAPSKIFDIKEEKYVR
jgi:L-threonylcarbamoyladenylate synthase|tara:strand:- start:25271 stop:25792 length:522 start_codon:yes stop_codon:yes gene_type:complete